jgi:hypothetical protein
MSNPAFPILAGFDKADGPAAMHTGGLYGLFMAGPGKIEKNSAMTGVFARFGQFGPFYHSFLYAPDCPAAERMARRRHSGQNTYPRRF